MATNNEATEPKVTLTDVNYDIWSANIKIELGAQNVMHVIDANWLPETMLGWTAPTRPPQIQDVSQIPANEQNLFKLSLDNFEHQNKRYQEQKKKVRESGTDNHKALKLIREHLTKEQQMAYMNIEKANQLWKTLEATYSGAHVDLKRDLLNEYNNLHMTGKQSFTAWTETHEAAINRLAANGVLKTPSEQITQLIQGIHKNHRQVALALTTQKSSFKNVADLKRHMRMLDATANAIDRRDDNSSDDDDKKVAAYKAQIKQLQKQIQLQKRKSDSVGEKGGSGNTTTEATKDYSNVTCYKCRGKGHIARYCKGKKAKIVVDEVDAKLKSKTDKGKSPAKESTALKDKGKKKSRKTYFVIPKSDPVFSDEGGPSNSKSEDSEQESDTESD